MMMTGKPGMALATVQQVEARAAGHPDVGDEHLRGLVVLESASALRACRETARGKVLRGPGPFRAPSGSIGRRLLSRSASYIGRLKFLWALQFSHVVHGGSPAHVAWLCESGSRIWNSVRPGLLSHSIRPSCCCTKVCARVRPKSAAVFASRHQRIEDAVADVLGDAGSVVDDMQVQCQLMQLLGDRHLARDARAQIDLRIALRRCVRSALRPRCARCSGAPGSTVPCRRGIRARETS